MADDIKNVKLSKRLMAVANMVDKGARVADIGTDHGFVPIYLALNNISNKIIAMDVRTGPLDRARTHVREYKLSNIIDVRLSDGLQNLNVKEADTIICAGMGGMLMKKIIEDGKPKEKGIQTLILEPQSDLLVFRKFLRENYFEIIDEDFVFDEGKFYPIIKAKIKDDFESKKAYEDTISYLEKEYENYIEKYDMNVDDLYALIDEFGPIIIKEKNNDFKRYLVHEISVCDTILDKIQNKASKERVDEINKRKKYLMFISKM